MDNFSVENSPAPGLMPEMTVAERLANLEAVVTAQREELQELRATRDGFAKEFAKEVSKDITRALHKRDHDSARTVEVNKPEPFDGAQEHTEQFLQSLRLAFSANPTKFFDSGRNHLNRIVYALSFMTKGRAATWARIYAKRNHEDLTWEEFEEAVKKRFADKLPKRTAQLKIQTLQQGNGSFDDYLNAFEQYDEESRLGEEALLMFFKLGLDPAIHAAVHALRPMPTTLQGWKDAAQDIDRQNQEYKADQQATRRSTVTVPRTPAATIQAPFSRAVPRPVTQFNTNTKPAVVPTSQAQASSERRDSTGVTFGGRGQPMDIDVARRRGVCFRCHQPGHMARACPNRAPMNVRQLAAELTREELEELLREAEDQMGEEEAPAVAGSNEGFPDARE